MAAGPRELSFLPQPTVHLKSQIAGNFNCYFLLFTGGLERADAQGVVMALNTCLLATPNREDPPPVDRWNGQSEGEASLLKRLVRAQGVGGLETGVNRHGR